MPIAVRTCLNFVPHVSPSGSRSRRGHNHLPRVTPLVGCWFKTLTGGLLQKCVDQEIVGRRFSVKLPHLSRYPSDGDPEVVIEVCIVCTCGCYTLYHHLVVYMMHLKTVQIQYVVAMCHWYSYIISELQRQRQQLHRRGGRPGLLVVGLNPCELKVSTFVLDSCWRSFTTLTTH
jgi:hypothetical protein